VPNRAGVSWLRDHEAFAAILLTAVVVIVILAILERTLRRREASLEARYPGDFASAKTRFRLLRRITVALVVMIGAIATMLEFAPALGQTLLASSAVAAIVAGLALRTPLANVAAGVQLALTQPFRLGDRIRVGAETGVVDEIKVAYTVLRTDDGRRAYIPNEQIIATPIVNATIDDPIRSETIRIPVSLDADLDIVIPALRDLVVATEGHVADPAPSVRVDDLTSAAVIVAITVWTADGQQALRTAAAVRERAIARLRDLGALARA
jgi:small-conductance mechanosensitive channel